MPLPAAPALLRVGAFIASLKSNAAARALKSLLATRPPLAGLLGGIAEAAPYLWDLVQADPARLVRLLEADPGAALAALLDETKNAAAAAHAPAEVMRLLRRMKAEAALLIAFADIGGVWSVASITGALTDVADAALGVAVHFVLRQAVKRKKLAPPDRKAPEAGERLYRAGDGQNGRPRA